MSELDLAGTNLPILLCFRIGCCVIVPRCASRLTHCFQTGKLIRAESLAGAIGAGKAVFVALAKLAKFGQIAF